MCAGSTSGASSVSAAQDAVAKRTAVPSAFSARDGGIAVRRGRHNPALSAEYP